MFKELGDALMKRELWDTAIDFWGSLHDRAGVGLSTLSQLNAQVDDEPSIIFKLGLCQHNLQRYEPALESLRWGMCLRMDQAHSPVVEMEKSNTEARMALARVLEDMGQKDEAYEIVTERKWARSGAG